MSGRARATTTTTALERAARVSARGAAVRRGGVQGVPAGVSLGLAPAAPSLARVGGARVGTAGASTACASAAAATSGLAAGARRAGEAEGAPRTTGRKRLVQRAPIRGGARKPAERHEQQAPRGAGRRKNATAALEVR